MSWSIMIALPHWSHVANVLRTGPLDVLRRSLPGVPIVLVSPLALDPKFREEFGAEGMSFAPLVAYDPVPLERRLYGILAEKFFRRTRLEAAKLQRERTELLSQGGLRLGRRMLGRALAALPVPRSVWLSLSHAVAPERWYGELFREHRPGLVVTSTAGLQFSEIPLIRRARRDRVPLMAADLSWDHLTLKTLTTQPMDHLVVWNEQLRREAIEYHDYAPAAVEVSGVPQFDHYFRKSGIVSREAFLSRLGADPARKLVTFATVPQSRHGRQVPIIRALHEADRAGRLGAPITILVRLHPQDDLTAYAELEGLPHVIIEKPFRVAAEFDPYGIDPTPEDRDHQSNTLCHSAVVINMASTITIEACIFDTPVVNFSFEGDAELPLPLAARRYYRYEHYKQIVAAGAARVADRLDQLVDAVVLYLKAPETDRAGRARVVREQCAFSDGRAGERVGEAIARAFRKSA